MAETDIEESDEEGDEEWGGRLASDDGRAASVPAVASLAHCPRSSAASLQPKRPAVPARPRPARLSGGRSALLAQPSSSASASSPPAIVLLGSAAFESVMEQVERSQQQQTALQRQAAFPFVHIHVHNRHAQHTQPQTDAEQRMARPSAAIAQPAKTAPATATTATTSGAQCAQAETTGALSAASSPPPLPALPLAPTAAPAHSAAKEAASTAALPQSVETVSAGSGSGSGKSLTHLLLLCCELLSSERTYVSRLDELTAQYVLPLKARHSSLNIAREDVDQLFSYVEVIGELHHKILEHLQRKAHAMSSSAAGQQAVDAALLDACVANIAACFVQFAAYLKMYVQYVNQYNASMETLKRLTDNKKFVKFVSAVPQQQPQQQQAVASAASPLFELQSLLILPIQRIPRYELFLVSIHKHVDASFGCHGQLSSALSLVQRLASLINESKRQAENGVKMMELKRRVKGLAASQPLLAPHRRLLREDAVMQLLPKRREYVLVTFNDGLMLLSHAYRLKGFYLTDDIAAVRHYEPKAAHAALTALAVPAAAARSRGELSPQAEDVQQQQREETEADSGEDEDDSEYPSCVEIELRKGRSDGDGGSGGSAPSSGVGQPPQQQQAGARLKRFSLAFTAAVASLTELNTIVVQFASDADKQAWAAEWARHAHQAAPPQQTAAASNAPQPSLSAMLHAITNASNGHVADSADSNNGHAQQLPTSLASPLPSPASPLSNSKLPTLPQSLPSCTPPSRSVACPVVTPSFGSSPAHLLAGAVPVLPARPRSITAQLHTAASSASAAAAFSSSSHRSPVLQALVSSASSRPEWQPFSYTAAALPTAAPQSTRRPTVPGAHTPSSTDATVAHGSGNVAHNSPPPLLSAFQRSQQTGAFPVNKQHNDNRPTDVRKAAPAPHNKENRNRSLVA